ncbi:hypothetical protein GHK29_34035 [Sinorhizobium medicae]|uniref:hypothetical protein n=1 Tax=Sinorhizobium medicae TaxID=110321 RepID=UPI001296F1F8|nr:hypothetical protein [Sinorhizobium medicae]MDX2387959.1 hypothetical protein [Sinorhizobium medicae]MQU79456.1 hypothetical protein [Sinorhizobium medicae]
MTTSTACAPRWRPIQALSTTRVCAIPACWSCRTSNVTLYSTGAVHVAVTLIKQQDNAKRIRVTRRIKREWGPLFNELVKRRDAGTIQPDEGVPSRLLFGLTPSRISRSIMELTAELTGEGRPT